MIAIVTENVWAYLPVESTIVLALDSAAMMTVADDPWEMRARTAPQTVSAPALLSVASIMFAEIRVLGLGLLSAATYLVIVRRAKEIVTTTGNVKALWSVEVTTVMDPDSVAAMTVANNQV